MPVSKISVVLTCSSKDGGGLWMGLWVGASTGPRLSRGSPVTLNNRPRVSAPTGTETGLPESSASTPRARPSVGPRARQRTQLFPTCCSTSRTSLSPLLSTITALYRPGSWSGGNSTSTTVPITCTTLPLATRDLPLTIAVHCAQFPLTAPSALQGNGATHYIQELTGDAVLPYLVQVQGQVLHQVPGGVSGVAHGHHAR